MIQRLDDAPTQVQRDQSSYEREWRNFVNVNGKTMFQIALLLSGDACAAEEALINGVDKLDVSRPPEPDDLAMWEKTVVMRSIEMSDTPHPLHSFTLNPCFDPNYCPSSESSDVRAFALFCDCYLAIRLSHAHRCSILTRARYRYSSKKQPSRFSKENPMA